MKPIRALSIIGTRPEAVKMCPLVRRLAGDSRFEAPVLVTGQHGEMLNQVLEAFLVTPTENLQLLRPGDSLAGLTARLVEGVYGAIGRLRPDVVLVHGDTASCFAGALAAFYQKCPVAHVEAGLRTYRRYAPFPEEMNRVLTARLADLHFAPTHRNRDQLLQEGIPAEEIHVTGNTVLDAFSYTVHPGYRFADPTLSGLSFENPTLLVTAHRRENRGEPLENICRAVKTLVTRFPDLQAVWPVHPAVQETVDRLLSGLPRVHLLPPLQVTDLHNLLPRVTLILTDSGGLQEEGPSFQKPVLVLRQETERPEALEAGCTRLVGTETERIVAETAAVLENPQVYQQFSKNQNPYGDGHAADRIARVLAARYS